LDTGSFLDVGKVLRGYVSCRGSQDRDVSLVWFLLVRRRGWCLKWRFGFGGCFLAGFVGVLEGMVEDFSVKTVGMDAGLVNKGEKWACGEIWAPV
jgi:hypothetical protein